MNTGDLLVEMEKKDYKFLKKGLIRKNQISFLSKFDKITNLRLIFQFEVTHQLQKFGIHTFQNLNDCHLRY